jgi:Integrase core domain
MKLMGRKHATPPAVPDGRTDFQRPRDSRLAGSPETQPTAPASPWQNGFVERLIGSIRRDCVDHIIILGEAHLRRILKSYADYYNCVRTHRSLNKDAPVSRPVQRTGVISSRAILGGLHHRYARV